MSARRTAPYGSWASPLSAERAVAAGIGLGDVAFDGPRVLWQESRPAEKGRQVLMRLEPDGTLRDFDVREVQVARTIIEQSRQVWLAADHSKFGRPAMVEVGRLEQVRQLFTDRAPPEPFGPLLQAAGVSLVLAGEEEA